MHKALLAVAVFVFTLGIGELAAQTAFFLFYGPPLPESKRIHEYDPELGWRNRPAFRAPDRYGPGEDATHNRHGFRAAREFSQTVPSGRYRVLFVGDSFTYGIIGDAKTFPAALEHMVPSIESVNMGGAGYGVDQAYLWYRRQGTLAAQMIVFAVIADDFKRMGMDAFMTKLPKPILQLSGSGLRVTNVPVPTWGAATPHAWYQDFPNRLALVQAMRKIRSTYLVQYDPLPVASRVLSEVSSLAKGRGQTAVFAYLPVVEELRDTKPPRAAGWLSTQCLEHGYLCIDLTQSFRAMSPIERAAAFQRDGHYAEAGNRHVARFMKDALAKLVPGFPSH